MSVWNLEGCHESASSNGTQAASPQRPGAGGRVAGGGAGGGGAPPAVEGMVPGTVVRPLAGTAGGTEVRVFPSPDMFPPPHPQLLIRAAFRLLLTGNA